MPASAILPKQLRSRAFRCLSTWPTPAGWRAAAAALFFFALFALSFGYLSGFFQPHLTSMPLSKFLGVTAIVFVFPGITEEFVFRGLVLPHPTEEQFERTRLRDLIVSVFVFVFWHVGNAWLTFPVARPVFWDWRFLTIVVGLGWACGWSYQRTGSLWPSVLIHWFIVVIWKAFLGGPVFFE
jgi:predicted Abi (CAAX) family protease